MACVLKPHRDALKTIGLLFCVVVLVLPAAAAGDVKSSDLNEKTIAYDGSIDQIIAKQAPLKIAPESFLKDQKFIDEANRRRNTLDDPVVLITLFDVMNSQYGYCVEYGFVNFETYAVDVNLVTELRLPNGHVYGGTPFPITLQALDGYGMSFIAQYGPNSPTGMYSFAIHIYDALTGHLLDERTMSWIHDSGIYRRMYPEQAYS